MKSINRIGLFLFAGFLVTALFADILTPHDPWQRFEAYLPPQPNHLLGTNDIGNDILSELIYGTRASLVVGLGTAILATSVGLVVGLLAGYFRGLIDEILMAITDVVLMLPRIPIIIIIAAFLKAGCWTIIIVLGSLWWTTTARVARSRTLQVREMTFVTSSRSLGFSHAHILFTDVLPHLVHVIIPKFMLTVAAAMISEASLSFLGLGDPDQKSWGMMIRFAFERGGFINDMWWWYTAPGLAVTLCVLSIVLLGFSLEEEETGPDFREALPEEESF